MTTEHAVQAAEEARQRAMIEADVATLDRLFADELVWIHGTGRVNSKSVMLDRIGSKATIYHSFDNSEVAVREINGLIFISGLSTMRLSVGDQTGEVTNRYTIVWRSVDDAWQVVNWQSTPVQD